MRQGLNTTATYRVRNDDKNDRDFPGLSQECCRYRRRLCKDHLWRRSHQFSCICAHAIGVGSRIAKVNSDCTFSPSKLLETLSEGCDVGLRQWVIFGEAHKHTDTRHALTMLRARRERPRRRCAAEKRDELTAAAHSITSSARASSEGEISRPSALA